MAIACGGSTATGCCTGANASFDCTIRDAAGGATGGEYEFFSIASRILSFRRAAADRFRFE